MIYLDNSATTYPKPLKVKNSMITALEKFGANSGRSGYKMAMETSEKIFECREKLSEMFNADSSENVAFTLNCTHALNMAIKGLVHKGDHIIISNIEHNAVARPIENLANMGYITYSAAKYSQDDEQTVANFKALINEKTTLIVCMHASNVFGVMLPIEEIGQLAKDNNLNFIVDSAQTAGVCEIDIKKSNITALCMPGHKGLYGPMGTGVLITSRGESMQTIIEGGTGSSSSSLLQPNFMPDRFESGTENTSGIIALSSAIDFVNSFGYAKIQKHEYSLTSELYENLKNNSNVKLYTKKPSYPYSMPIISFNYKDYSSEKTATLLNEKNIAVRAGYHCAYNAHKAFETEKYGTVRVCPSVFTNEKDIIVFTNIIKNL